MEFIEEREQELDLWLKTKFSSNQTILINQPKESLLKTVEMLFYLEKTCWNQTIRKEISLPRISKQEMYWSVRLLASIKENTKVSKDEFSWQVKSM